MLRRRRTTSVAPAARIAVTVAPEHAGQQAAPARVSGTEDAFGTRQADEGAVGGEDRDRRPGRCGHECVTLTALTGLARTERRRRGRRVPGSASARAPATTRPASGVEHLAGSVRSRSEISVRDSAHHHDRGVSPRPRRRLAEEGRDVEVVVEVEIVVSADVEHIASALRRLTRDGAGDVALAGISRLGTRRLLRGRRRGGRRGRGVRVDGFWDSSTASNRSKPAAITVTRTVSPERVVDDAAEDDVGVGVSDVVDDLSRLVHLEQRRGSLPPAMLSRMPRAPSIEASSSGLVMAWRAALTARALA